jgi:predicted NUDIX family NTP pyrophosphohydrolase
MAKRSAALLLYRLTDTHGLEVLIAHMGGPFWSKKNARAWSIPKGEYEEHEKPLLTAFREFEEEMGSAAPEGPIIELGDKKQPSGKVITTYAIEGGFDVSKFHSNTFEMEWPKGSGQMQEFPEVDRAAWMSVREAEEMLVKGQVPIIEALADYLRAHGVSEELIVGSLPDGKAATLF